LLARNRNAIHQVEAENSFLHKLLNTVFHTARSKRIHPVQGNRTCIVSPMILANHSTNMAV